MRILVTGGAGFIGSNFIHYILKKYPNYKVVNFDALTYAGNLENLKDLEKNKNYKFIKGDIADPKAVAVALKGVDAIVNFAAESHVDRSILSAADFVRTNIMGTAVLLAEANKNKIRFHHISTDEVFGDLGVKDKPFDETTRYNPHSPYSASKAASDHLVRSYYHTYGLPITISNCSNNYGPYQFPEKLHGLFITNLLSDKKVPIYGAGKNIRDWIYVEDHCEGVDKILHHGKIGETYCLGGNAEKTNLEVAYEILRLAGKNKNYLEFVKDRPGHDRRYAINFSKAKKELGWQPRTSFSEGMKKTFEWYKNNPQWWQEVKTGDYLKYYKKQYGKIK